MFTTAHHNHYSHTQRDPYDHSMMGTVGLPLPGVDMRLEAVPELGYLPSDKNAPKGEVCEPTLRAESCIGEGAALLSNLTVAEFQY